VFFDSPASKAACPKVAACWSPRIPATGTSRRVGDDAVNLGRTGSRAASISGLRNLPGFRHPRRVSKSMNRVREALVTSVYTIPPVKFHATRVGGAEQQIAASAFSTRPSTSRIHTILVPEK
jgi:hypothetical protein